MRPNSMTDQNNASVVSNVLYGVANEMLQMTYNGGTETRSYNTMFQLTNISGLGQNITYNFPAGSNVRSAIYTTSRTGWCRPTCPAARFSISTTAKTSASGKASLQTRTIRKC